MASTTASSEPKQRSQSIGALLEPWVEEFAKYGHARVAYSKPRIGPQVATIEFVLSNLTEGYASRDDVRALRDALDVLHIAALQDVRVVEEALSGLCYHDIEVMFDEEEPVAATTVDMCKGRTTEVSFTLTFYGAQGRFLEEVVGPCFFQERESRSDAFNTAREVLLMDMHTPVTPMVCRVNIVSMDAGFLDEVEDDYMERVVSFVQQLDSYASSNQSDSDDASTKLVLTGVDFELNELTITSKTAQAVSHLMQVSIPVSCTRLAIDPRTLSCSREELTQFLNGIGSAASPMTVDVGHINASEPSPNLDADGSNMEQLIETIFRGVADSVAVSGVSFGPLISLMGVPSNRKAVWMELFRCLTSSATSISFLGVSPQIQLHAEDAVYIEEAAAIVNESKRPITIKTVALWLNESSAAAVNAFITAIGSQVESCSLQSDIRAGISSSTVTTVLNECPQLSSLSLVAAEIESMDVFIQKPLPLSSLTLNWVTVKDKESLTSFLSTLADPSSAVARHLTKLHLRSDNDSPQEENTIGLAETEILETILRNNRTLRDLEVNVSADTPTDLIARIQRHDREVLAEPLLLRQKLAFLSMIQEDNQTQLDQDVARLVFAFAAERVSRRVYVEW